MRTLKGIASLPLCVFCLLPATFCRAEGVPAPIGAAEAAIVQMAQGNFREAARQARTALQATPADATICTLAGAILLNTGDPRRARAVFQNGVTAAPDDSLARYGLGLAQLDTGDRAAALDSFQRAQRSGGDPTYLLLATRYTQWLGGAKVAVDGAGLTEAQIPAQETLQGMTAYRLGDRAQAIAHLEAGLKALPGDAIVQPGGVLMSFEADHPLTTAAPPLPADSLQADSSAKTEGLSGSVEFTPEEAPASVAYVAYELDGQTLGLVNVRPFAYTWDSRRAANGWHSLTVVLYDNEAHEVTKATRRIRVFNRGLRMASVDPERLARLRTALWQALTLRPDRCACAYALGVSYRALGNTAAARTWFARAAAVQPEYRDVRGQLAACGGVGEGGPTVFGGTPTEKIIALTFDDGPKPGVTEPLLDMLASQHIPATFFVIGRHVMEYPELTKRITDAGYEIANHSYTHRNLTKLPAEEVAREIMETQAAILTATGKMPRFLRPPGGDWNPTVADTVRRWGLTPCMWTVDVYGSEVIGAQQVADAVLTQVRPGSIILMHNGKVSTLQALPTIIRELRARGYTFATVDTLARRLGALRANPSAFPRRVE